jgi:hypothetical protein
MFSSIFNRCSYWPTIFLVDVKQNGNGIVYPVRPYRSKDYSMTSERRHNPSTFKSHYSTGIHRSSPRRTTLKETDLDHMTRSLSKHVVNESMENLRVLPIDRVQTISPTRNTIPLTMQRRSSFQTATKLNGFDVYSKQQPVCFFDKSSNNPAQRHHYSPERDLRERDIYRERRRADSPHWNQQTSHRNNSVVMDNDYLNKNDYLSSTNDPSWGDTNDYERNQWKDNQNLLVDRDDGIFV